MVFQPLSQPRRHRRRTHSCGLACAASGRGERAWVFRRSPQSLRIDAPLVCCEGLKIAKRKRSAKKLYEPHGNRPDEAAPSRSSVPRFQIHAHTEMRVLYRAFWLSACPSVSRPQILTDSLLSFCLLRTRHPSQLVIVSGRFYSPETPVARLIRTTCGSAGYGVALS
jgi:hypothetical protein